MRSAILLDVPESFETERLLVRCPLPGDGPAIYAAVRESLDDLRPWMPWAREEPTVEQFEEYARRARAHHLAREELPLVLLLKGSDTVVGGSGLHRIDWDVPRFEVGYWCRTGLHRQGYATEAVRGITRFAFMTLGARRVEIRCDHRNDGSRRVAERAGYTREATLRNHSLALDGSLRDTLVYALTPGEFEERYP